MSTTSTPRKAAARKATARRTPNETKPKAIVVENHLHYRTLDGDEIRVPLNLKLPVLELFLELDEKLDADPRELFALVGKVVGDDIDKVGLLDIADLFGEWSGALGTKFGQARLGNSSASSN